MSKLNLRVMRVEGKGARIEQIEGSKARKLSLQFARTINKKTLNGEP
jgi:hypothetical protein